MVTFSRMMKPSLCLNASRSTLFARTVPEQYSHRYPYIRSSLLRNPVDGDDQVSTAVGKAPDGPNRGLTIGSGPFHYVLPAGRIVLPAPCNGSVEDRRLDVHDVQVVFSHLLHCMRRHVVQSNPDSGEPELISSGQPSMAKQWA